MNLGSQLRSASITMLTAKKHKLHIFNHIISARNPEHGCPPYINPPGRTRRASRIATMKPDMVVKSLQAPWWTTSYHCLNQVSKNINNIYIYIYDNEWGSHCWMIHICAWTVLSTLRPPSSSTWGKAIQMVFLISCKICCNFKGPKANWESHGTPCRVFHSH